MSIHARNHPRRYVHVRGCVCIADERISLSLFDTGYSLFLNYHLWVDFDHSIAGLFVYRYQSRLLFLLSNDFNY